MDSLRGQLGGKNHYARTEVLSIQTCTSDLADKFWFGDDPFKDDSYEIKNRRSLYERILETESRATLVATPFLTSFDPLSVTMLDLSSLREGAGHIFKTGELPKWVCNFKNLQSLNIAKTGLIILQPWLVNFTELTTLHLEHNLITTWPWFLRGLTKMQCLNLDGNPCLEKAFCKSPTLKSWFFSWKASNEMCRSIPKYIRGEEWPPASSARLNNSSIMNGLGFFCGGIYLLTTKEETFDDGLLTPLEPDPLFTRLYSANSESLRDEKQGLKAVSEELNSNYSSNYLTSPSKSHVSIASSTSYLNSNGSKIAAKSQNARQTNLLKEIFDDIYELRERNQLPPPSTKNLHVLLVGGASDNVNRLLCSNISKDQRFTVDELFKFASLIAREEEAYILELDFVCKHFYQARPNSLEICNQLRIVFTAFPAMLSIHKKCILPSLRAFEKALSKLAQLKKKEADGFSDANGLNCFSADFTLQMAANLATSFRKLQLAFESYVKNLWKAEYLLDVNSAATRLYTNEEFSEYISSRIAKLNGLGGHSGGGFSVHPSTIFSTESLNFPKFSASKESFGSSNSASETTWKKLSKARGLNQWNRPKSLKEWVNDELCMQNPIIRRNPEDFIYIPLARLTRYERFFTSFSRENHMYDTLVRFFRSMRRLAASEIQIARRKARCETLSVKFKIRPKYFEHYKWDAVLIVRSRGYLEHGIKSKNTMDVLDIDNQPVSFVKEVFDRSKLRVLRVIYCGNEIILWDEVFEQYIGRVQKNMLVAIPAYSTEHPSELRIVFLDANETCLVEVKDFRAKYITRLDARREFLDACRFDCKLIL